LQICWKAVVLLSEVGQLIDDQRDRLVTRRAIGGCPQCSRPRIKRDPRPKQIGGGQIRFGDRLGEPPQRYVRRPSWRLVVSGADTAAVQELLDQSRLADPATSAHPYESPLAISN